MNKIKVLNDHLTNMIAAGEVVERPAGIIKELVENAIDADSKHITVTVKDAGMSLIEVSDDGYGMSPEDLIQAFSRHSTSKIQDQDDLNAIKTFGFRGEALPSIASVTMTIASSKMEDNIGTFVSIDNGKQVDQGLFARNTGTTISIQDLFLKTPARLKHIKSIRYENTIILDVIQKFALGHPNIAFTLINDDRESYRSLGNGDLFDVFARIYGSQVARESIVFNAENFDFKIEGVMALPMHSRSNRNAMILYINQRMIRFPKVQNAIINGYRRHMASDRYPIVVMNITVDPQLVDVNVHPSKWEIRLSKDDELQALIIDHFEKLLSEHMKVQRIYRPKEKVEQLDIMEPLVEAQPYVKPIMDIKIDVQEPIMLQPIAEPVIEKPSIADVFEPSRSKDIKADNSYLPNLELDNKQEPPEENIKPSIESLEVLSQFAGNYILAQGGQGLYIIDQHAAMERIRYEYYQNLLLQSNYHSQTLLIPMVFEGRQLLVERLEEINDHFKQFQIQLEAFGQDSFVLREYPLWIKEKDVFEFINDVLDGFLEDHLRDEESVRQDALATLACHSSVRFNEYLSYDEMVGLVADLRACKQPYHCPHGRPTLLNIDHKFLLKEFKR